MKLGEFEPLTMATASVRTPELKRRHLNEARFTPMRTGCSCVFPVRYGFFDAFFYAFGRCLLSCRRNQQKSQQKCIKKNASILMRFCCISIDVYGTKNANCCDQ